MLLYSRCHSKKPSHTDPPFPTHFTPTPPLPGQLLSPSPLLSQSQRRRPPRRRKEYRNNGAQGLQAKNNPFAGTPLHGLGFERKPDLRAEKASRSSFSSQLFQLSLPGTGAAEQRALVPAQVLPPTRGALGVQGDRISPGSAGSRASAPNPPRQ